VERERTIMSAFSFSNDLTSENKILTPPLVEKLTREQRADTYETADLVFIHFPDVHTTTKSQNVFEAISAVAEGAGGRFWGDELVVSVPKPVFQKKFQFQGAQPS
jgi:hypothetical protein